jgi:excisionase family DNA binding protein
MKPKKITLQLINSTASSMEAALVLGVTRQRVSALVAAGRLDAVRIGTRQVRITRASLEACVADRQRRGIMPTAE